MFRGYKQTAIFCFHKIFKGTFPYEGTARVVQFNTHTCQVSGFWVRIRIFHPIPPPHVPSPFGEETKSPDFQLPLLISPDLLAISFKITKLFVYTAVMAWPKPIYCSK